MALAGVDEAALQAAAADPTLGIGVFRARLARGEREQAIDWFLARGATLQPSRCRPTRWPTGWRARRGRAPPREQADRGQDPRERPAALSAGPFD